MTVEDVFCLNYMAQKNCINIRNRNADSIYLEAPVPKIVSERGDS